MVEHPQITTVDQTVIVVRDAVGHDWRWSTETFSYPECKQLAANRLRELSQEPAMLTPPVTIEEHQYIHRVYPVTLPEPNR